MTRDAMVEEHLGLVYDVARRLERSSGVGPERSDLVSAGVIGLMQAIESFEPSRGLAFSTLAVTRIRGAMLDEMRRWDHAPRSVRKKERQIKQSEAELRTRLERQPSAQELADDLALSPEELHAWYLDVARHVGESLDDSPGGATGESRDLQIVDAIGDEGTDVVERLGRDDAVRILHERIVELPEREAQVLALYYFEELRSREIAQILGVSESRISQIRHAALNTLRSMLNLAGVVEP